MIGAHPKATKKDVPFTGLQGVIHDYNTRQKGPVPGSTRPNPIRKTFRNNRKLDAFAVEKKSFAVGTADEHEVSTVEKGNTERVEAKLFVFADLLPVDSVE